MEEAVEKFSTQRYVKSWKTFCPIGFRNWRKVIDHNAAEEFGAETYAVHLWHEMWRSAAQDKNVHYHPACLYERLRRKYLGDRERVSLESVRSILESLS